MNADEMFAQAMAAAVLIHAKVEPIADEIVANMEKMMPLSPLDRESLKSYIMREAVRGILGL